MYLPIYSLPQIPNQRHCHRPIPATPVGAQPHPVLASARSIISAGSFRHSPPAGPIHVQPLLGFRHGGDMTAAGVAPTPLRDPPRLNRFNDGGPPPAIRRLHADGRLPFTDSSHAICWGLPPMPRNTKHKELATLLRLVPPETKSKASAEKIQ